MEDRLSHVSATPAAYAILFKSLKANPFIYDVTLYSSYIDDNVIQSIAPILPHCKNIHHLRLPCNQFTDSGVLFLAPFLVQSPHLRTITLSYNKNISFSSSSILLDVLRKSSIEEMFIDATSIPDKSLIAKYLVLNKLKNGARKLELDVVESDMAFIVESIKTYPSNIDEVVCSSNKFSVQAARALFQALESCINLKYLDLSESGLSENCLPALISLLKKLPMLKFLGLGRNHFGDLTVSQLAIMYTGNTLLETIDFYRNKITDASSVPLQTLAKKSHILTIDILRNNVSPTVVAQLENLLQIPVQIREIPISSSAKGANKASATKT